MSKSGRNVEHQISTPESIQEIIQLVGDDIYRNLKNDSQSDILDKAHEWAERHGLNRTEDSHIIVCRLVAYDQLLKVSLYGLYKIENPDLLGITTPEDISKRLSDARHLIEDAAFNPYIFDELADAVDDYILNPLLNNRHQIVNLANPTHDIACIFEQLVPQEARRKLGQFRTPGQIAELMAEWSISRGDDIVLDPGMGTGVLTLAAYNSKKKTWGRESINDMWGIDLSELAVVMSSTALKLVNGQGAPHLLSGDFLKMKKKEGQFSNKTSKHHSFPPVDVVISNPPYSRHHELSFEEKVRINQLVEDETGLAISKRAPMYLYFYLLADKFLREGGRLSFITPSEFFDTNYGIALKKYLLQNYHIHGFLIADSKLELFENARTTGCISFLEKKGGRESSDTDTTFIKMSRLPQFQELTDAISGEVSGPQTYGVVNNVPQQHLDPDAKWTNYFSPHPNLASPDLKPFKEIAEVKRGIATGKNEYFCLTPSDIENWGINKIHLSRIVRKKDGNSNYIFDEDWWNGLKTQYRLLYHIDDTEILDDALAAYIEYGEDIGVNNGYLTSNRDCWFRVERRDPPDIIGTYMSSNGFRFIWNKAGVRTLNNYHNLYTPRTYSDNQKMALLAYLNSNLFDKLISQNCRTYSGGMKKIEPGELKDMPVLDPTEISNKQIMDLRRFFDHICLASNHVSLDVKEVKRELDEYLKSIIEF